MTEQRAIEFHDSELTDLAVRGQGLVARLDAYVHHSSGRPGVDEGTGWQHKAELRFVGSTLPPSFPALPVTILDGSIDSADGPFDGIVPVPATIAGPLTLRLVLADGSHLIIAARSMVALLLDEGTFIEKFEVDELGLK